MVVLVDMDDVLEGLLEGWLSYNNEKFGTYVTLDDIKEWDLSAAFPGISKEEVYAAELDPAIWKRVKPLPGAVEYLKRIIDDGHQVYIVTATLYQSLKEKMDDVLFRYFPYISWNQVIITSHKELVKGDVLVDDGPHNLVVGDYKKILFTAPHNRFVDEKALGAVRVNNWPEAYAAINALEKELTK